MSLVVDASVVVAALIDDGVDGRWAEETLKAPGLAAPHLLPAEVVNILRRSVLAGAVSDELASIAQAELSELRIELFPFEPLSDRVWELRGNVTAYDAWYVALAEALGAPLASLDVRLSQAPGPRCSFMVRPG